MTHQLANAVSQRTDLPGSLLSHVLTQQMAPSQGSFALLDLRIGLHLLGQEGRLLLAQYLRVKSQQEI